MKAENNPYFKNHYKPFPLWKVVLKLLAIPFLYVYTFILKGLVVIIEKIFKLK
jgi:hypothetical protein